MISNIDTLENGQPSYSASSPTLVMKRHAEGELDRAVPFKKRQRMHRVRWSDNAPVIHELPNYTKVFKGCKKEDIWYKRSDYVDFMVDRLKTVQLLRKSGGDRSVLDKKKLCIRGLEVFQTPDSNEESRSQRRFHQSTILIEQIRQAMYGIKNPERFRFMVGPQSEAASRRARELAALDEHEVYGRIRRRGSLFTPSKQVSMSGQFIKDSYASETNDLDEQIRQLQESNVRRLIEIYSTPGYNPFQFPLRRDSLPGSNVGTQDGISSAGIGGRFRIRRDSLTHVSTAGMDGI